MTDRATITENLHTVFTSFGSVLAALTPEQWMAQSLCPAWTVQGVAMHVLSVEEVLLGWRPGDESPFARVPAVVSELGALAPMELVARYNDITGRRIAEIGAMTDDMFEAPSVTPVGPGTYARLMAIREFDVWVHERDIRVPLAIPGDDSGPAAEMALDEVHGSIGFIVGKKIALADGRGIAIDLTGPVKRTLRAKVEGKAKRVEELPNPDVTLTADSLTFMLLACGRIDPEEPIADGRVTWSGDAELGAHAARHLAFTM